MENKEKRVFRLILMETQKGQTGKHLSFDVREKVYSSYGGGKKETRVFCNSHKIWRFPSTWRRENCEITPRGELLIKKYHSRRKGKERKAERVRRRSKLSTA